MDKVDTVQSSQAATSASQQQNVTSSQVESPQAGNQQNKKRNELNALPTRQYIDQTVSSVLLHGLQTLARERPADPLGFLGNFLLKHRPRVEESENN